MCKVRQQKELLSECTLLLQVACLIRVPSEVVKQRAQVSSSSSTLRILSHTLYHEVSSKQSFKEVAFFFQLIAVHVQKHSYNFIAVLWSPSTFPPILLLLKVIGMLCLRKPNRHVSRVCVHLHAYSKQLLCFLLYGVPTIKKNPKQNKPKRNQKRQKPHNPSENHKNAQPTKKINTT